MLTTNKNWSKHTKGRNMIDLAKDTEYGAHYKVYKDAIRQVVAYINGQQPKVFDYDLFAWFHIVTNPALKGKVMGSFGTSMKMPVTIQVDSYPNMLKYILKLAKELHQLSQQTGDPIEMKIPGNFFAFLKHTDSLVIHHRLSDNRDKIHGIVADWMSSYDIKAEKRQYDRSIYTRDPNNTSFTYHVANTVVKMMQENYNQMSSEALAVFGINNAIKLAQASI